MKTKFDAMLVQISKYYSQEKDQNLKFLLKDSVMKGIEVKSAEQSENSPAVQISIWILALIFGRWKSKHKQNFNDDFSLESVTAASGR